MKDAYSFDRDEEGLDRSFQAQAGAYHRIFERCGLEFYAVEAESGMMGGSESIDFLAPSGAGENVARDVRERRLRGGHRGRAQRPARAGVSRGARRAGRDRDAGRAHMRRARRVPRASTWRRPRRRCRSTKQDGTVVLALLRGDDRLEEMKLLAAVGAASRPSTDEEILKAFGAEGGSLGPVGFNGEVLADETLREGQFVVGREPHRLAPARRGGRARLRAALRGHPPAEGGRHVPELRRRAAVPDGDRGGPHLQARHALLGAARRHVPRRGRHREAADHGQLRDRARAESWPRRSSSATGRRA